MAAMTPSDSSKRPKNSCVARCKKLGEISHFDPSAGKQRIHRELFRSDPQRHADRDYLQQIDAAANQPRLGENPAKARDGIEAFKFESERFRREPKSAL